jgi:hypothetical protein
MNGTETDDTLICRDTTHPQHCLQPVLLLHMPPEALQASMLYEKLLASAKQ